MASTNEPSGLPRAGDIIPNSYIVILKDETSESAFKEHRDQFSHLCSASTNSGSPDDSSSTEPYDYVYNYGTLKGYCGTFSKEAIDEIASHPNVDYIEPNTVVTVPEEEESTTDIDVNYNESDESWTTEDYDAAIEGEAEEDTGIEHRSARTFQARRQTFQQPIPSWGLGAISHRSGASHRYVFDESAGAGITVFVLDTGIRTTHLDFGGRARWGANFMHGSWNTDVHGHGTHVAGTVAGHYFGVAKRATVVDVKVLGDDGFGTQAAIIAGIQWSVRNAPRGRAVINMSLYSSFQRAMNNAVDNAFRAGLISFVCAGNRNFDAGTMSPPSAPTAFTVGATVRTGARWPWSNFGRALDIFAPGGDIVSCGVRHDKDIVTKSGTSMACPHVAGVAACLMVTHRLQTPAAIRQQLLALSTRNMVANVGPGSPNTFLFNGM